MSFDHSYSLPPHFSSESAESGPHEHIPSYDLGNDHLYPSFTSGKQSFLSGGTSGIFGSQLSTGTLEPIASTSSQMFRPDSSAHINDLLEKYSQPQSEQDVWSPRVGPSTAAYTWLDGVSEKAKGVTDSAEQADRTEKGAGQEKKKRNRKRKNANLPPPSSPSADLGSRKASKRARLSHPDPSAADLPLDSLIQFSLPADGEVNGDSDSPELCLTGWLAEGAASGQKSKQDTLDSGAIEAWVQDSLDDELAVQDWLVSDPASQGLPDWVLQELDLGKLQAWGGEDDEGGKQSGLTHQLLRSESSESTTAGGGSRQRSRSHLTLSDAAGGAGVNGEGVVQVKNDFEQNEEVDSCSKENELDALQVQVDGVSGPVLAKDASAVDIEGEQGEIEEAPEEKQKTASTPQGKFTKSLSMSLSCSWLDTLPGQLEEASGDSWVGLNKEVAEA